MQKYQTFIGNITDVIANYIPGTLIYTSTPEDILSFTAAKQFRYGMRGQSEVQDNYIVYKMQCAYSCEKHSSSSNAYYISESDAKEQIDTFFTNLTIDYQQYKYELRSFKAETNDSYSYALAYFDVYEPAELITLTNNFEISANGTYIIGDKILNVDVPPTIEYQTIEGSSSSVPTDLNIKIEGNKEYTVSANGTYILHPSDNYDVMTSVTLDINVPTEVNLQDLGTISIISNGTTQYTPGENYDGFAAFTINTNIPVKSETSLSATGNGTYTPDEGTVYNKVTVNVPSDAKAEESLTITANGTYTPDEGKVYNKVTANIPSDKKTETTLTASANGNYTPAEGSVYSSVTVSVPSDAKTEVSLIATENKTYTPAEGSVYSSVDVNVPGKTEESLTITANGTYIPTAGSVYSSVTANVPGKTEESLTITANGTYTPDEGKVYSSVTANVPGTGDMYGFDSIGYIGSETISEDVAYSLTLYNAWSPSRTSASRLYYMNSKLKFAPLIDTSNVTTMANMYFNCYALACVPALNTALVTDMTNMFSNCAALVYIPDFNITNVTSFQGMFQFCTCLIPSTTYTSLQLDESKAVTYDLRNMFSYCTNITNGVVILGKNQSSKSRSFSVNLTQMCEFSSVPTITVGNNDAIGQSYRLDNISSIERIAQYNTSLTTVYLYNDVTDSAYQAFRACSALSTVYITDFTYPANCQEMFSNCTSLTTIQQNTSGLLTSVSAENITNCAYMFQACTSLANIGSGILTNIGQGFTSVQALEFSVCPLTTTSLANIVNDIGTVSTAGAGSSIKFKSNVYALLTSEQKATMESKGWKVVSVS